MKPMPRCKYCGKRFQPNGGNHHGPYCCRSCYLSMLFPRKGITAGDIEGCFGMTIKDAAHVLDVSYAQLRRKLNRNPDLRAQFPANGGAGRWIAERGYALNDRG